MGVHLTEHEGFLAELFTEAAPAPSQEKAARLLELVERLIASGDAATAPASFWHDYLDKTRRSPFLLALPDTEHRNRWADTVLPAIDVSDYTLETMLAQRLADHPERILFQDGPVEEPRRWTYDQIARRIRAYAASFLTEADGEPRVAILADNGIAGACADLACLVHDILVSPIDPHTNAETLTWIFDSLRINIVLTDREERRIRLAAVLATAKTPFHVFLLDPEAAPAAAHESILAKARSRLGATKIEEILSSRKRLGLHDMATVMFTSGSTGLPKGVVFNRLNLISKRFARAVALPRVGENDVLFSYLPLFHTFGRYLEMMGMLFWGGTYVFAGNPSKERLLAGLRETRPTGLIGIPRRWLQIRDSVLERAGDDAVTEELFREVVGGRLSWGLSAAGYLDPKVFHFFQRNGVDLCSGFGMTEATGGITMTPPGEYEENTVGVPLPLVKTRLSDEGEMQITGPYIARYLDDPPPADGEEAWLPTGDIFSVRSSGYLEIVDRIKDIYKNSRGQTIAPRRVELKFVEVPGIARAFLVGDGRNYNVLLIVADRGDPVIASFTGEQQVRDYFHKIVTAANVDLAPYERVVNFAVLERDFSLEKGELTPKGTFRRKTIVNNFPDVIRDLYRREYVELTAAGRTVRIPRWFFRDLGILETDIVATATGLVNRVSGVTLPIATAEQEGAIRVGDLEYITGGDAIDLGLFSRQPLLWAGNPSLVNFCPCKEGWDISLGVVSPQISIPWRRKGEKREEFPTEMSITGSRRLVRVNNLSAIALFGPDDAAIEAVRSLGEILGDVTLRLGAVIRRRLEALARHPELKVRCLAYRVLLLAETVPEYSELMPSFILSGLPFLDEESIGEIARANLERRRLDALRKRFHWYRTSLVWPTTPVVRGQFESLFTLLCGFARYHPGYYATVRAELVNWILHRVDPELAESAELHFERLAAWYEEELSKEVEAEGAGAWEGKLFVQDGLSKRELAHLEDILVGTTFLKESVALATDGERFDINKIAPRGIWISRILSLHDHRLYRISINTISEKHYDLLLMLRPDMDSALVHETNFWMISVRSYPHGVQVVPRFGCCRPDLGAISFAFVSDLSVWERVRGFAELSETGPGRAGWHNLFVRGMKVFFVGWRNSGGRIVPGAVTPRNVAVPEPDFREGANILSLAGWKRYRDPLDLVGPMICQFFRQIEHHYPRFRKELEWKWIFEACIEGLGLEEGRRFLIELRGCLEEGEIPCDAEHFAEEIDAFLESIDRSYHVPVPLIAAVNRFNEWERVNPRATADAQEQIVRELFRLYRLSRHGPIARYWLYRLTCFAGVKGATREAFDRLLARMFRSPGEAPTRMVELSDLQATLTGDEERMIFSRLVFPQTRGGAPLEVIAVGEKEAKQVIVRSRLTDDRGETFTVREPIEPAEIGEMIRLIILGGFPNIVSEQDRYFIAIDGQDRIVGGVIYKQPEPTVVHLDGIVVGGPLKRRGISSALLEDFCSRMESQGVEVITTHFFARAFYLAHDFHVDKAWGGLVRFLNG